MKIYYENISIVDTLNRCFLPHAGEDMNKKSFYLGYMTNRLISVKLGLMEPTDRDSYLNKRIETTGYLMGTLTYQCFYKINKEMKSYLMKEVNSGVWNINKNYQENRAKY